MQENGDQSSAISAASLTGKPAFFPAFFRHRLSRSLPRAIRSHIWFPIRLAIAWFVLSGSGLFFFRVIQHPAAAQQLVEAESRSLPTSLPPPSAILRINGSVTAKNSHGMLVIERRDGDRVTATIGNARPLRVVGDANEVYLADADDLPLYRLVLFDPTKAKILDASGAELWRIKREIDGDEETFKLYDGSETIRHRVKIKTDSFNVYASGPDRIAKGKPRDGGFESRRESGGTDAVVMGDVSLRQAAVLSLPVEAQIRVLLWLQASR